ncbi:hypothetical protein SAMD00019534_027050 [Acytostelium subglobosum LB1]|uniref:hypothetical protein n=1 Tax=Acytostelium subglobosum LB1 TaxID=1410327 RepID=UPI0006449106|nr:hypothetical protein SAMD00019534_027050 [Acytostelium subglobosum LB1]GAM19530.1 hypothetical protein SAMD00019534_027050 [Acytostelium subglobosum LB1]|eukprot:XP_012757457.1 hypothetical protein SAMD00019534_027050 [Acytostelium subglobosum LB1]
MLILPPYILRHIVSFVNDEIDRICLLLVCHHFKSQLEHSIRFNKVSSQRRDSFFPESNCNVNTITCPSVEDLQSLIISSSSSSSDTARSRSTPKLITSLRLDGNDPIPARVIPGTVQYLTLGDSFNQPLVPGSIPNSVISLIIGEYHSPFNHPLEPLAIPHNVTFLSLGRSYSQTLTAGVLPPSLTKLVHGGEASFAPGSIPTSLRHLVLAGTLSSTNTTGDPHGPRRAGGPPIIPQLLHSLWFGCTHHITPVQCYSALFCYLFYLTKPPGMSNIHYVNLVQNGAPPKAFKEICIIMPRLLESWDGFKGDMQRRYFDKQPPLSNRNRMYPSDLLQLIRLSETLFIIDVECPERHIAMRLIDHSSNLILYTKVEAGAIKYYYFMVGQ